MAYSNGYAGGYDYARTFTPTTDGYSIQINSESRGGGRGHSMWKHYGKAIPIQTTIIYTSGASAIVASPLTSVEAAADAGSGRGKKMVYPTPGGPYAITEDEATAIKADGTYSAALSAFV